MQALAKALVVAVTQLELRPEGDAVDSDVGALEGVAAALAEATHAELDALAEVVVAELEALKSGTGSRGHIEFLSTFMENFVEGWVGNQRAS